MIMAQSTTLADLIPQNNRFKHSLQIWQAFRNTYDYFEESIHDLCMLIAQTSSVIAREGLRPEQ